MQRILFIIILFSSLLIFSCEDEYIENRPSTLIVEGWIENDGYPIVILTKSLSISEEKVSMNELYDHLLRWAVVSIHDDKDSVVLVGKYDNHYFPPYIYTTGRMKGCVGKQYKLKVDYLDFHAEAVTTIPQPPSIDTLLVACADGSDSLYTLTACFKDNPTTKDYYQLFVRKGTESRQFLTAYLGNYDDEVLNEYNEVLVYNSRRFDTPKYSPHFSYDDTVTVKLTCVDSVSYRFWNVYEKQLAFGSNFMFAYSKNLPSNINGGLGYWCGYGADTKSIIIGREDE